MDSYEFNIKNRQIRDSEIISVCVQDCTIETLVWKERIEQQTWSENEEHEPLKPNKACSLLSPVSQEQASIMGDPEPLTSKGTNDEHTYSAQMLMLC